VRTTGRPRPRARARHRKTVGTVGRATGGLSPQKPLTPRPAAPAGIAAPAAPASPVAPPAPVDPFAPQGSDNSATLGAVANAGASYHSSLAGIAAAEGRALQGFGFKESGAGAPGAVQDKVSGRWFSVDLDNPYSEQARIKQQFDANRRQDLTSAGSAGSVFDGSYGATMRDTQQREGSANFGLQQSFLDALGGFGNQRQSALDDALGTISGARGGQADSEASTIKAGQGQPTPRQAFAAQSAGARKAAAAAEKAARKAAKKKRRHH
jgi:hypothetical protein